MRYVNRVKNLVSLEGSKEDVLRRVAYHSPNDVLSWCRYRSHGGWQELSRQERINFLEVWDVAEAWASEMNVSDVQTQKLRLRDDAPPTMALTGMETISEFCEYFEISLETPVTELNPRLQENHLQVVTLRQSSKMAEYLA